MLWSPALYCTKRCSFLSSSPARFQPEVVQMHSCRQRRTLDNRMRQCSSGFVRHRPQPGAWIRKSRAVRVPLGKSQTLPLTVYEEPPVSPKREPQWCPKDCGVGDCGPKSPPPLCPVQPHHLSTPQSPHLQTGDGNRSHLIGRL